MFRVLVNKAVTVVNARMYYLKASNQFLAHFNINSYNDNVGKGFIMLECFKCFNTVKPRYVFNFHS